LPVLDVTTTRTGFLGKGVVDIYTIVVENRGNGPTSGTVTVTIDLPNGLALRSLIAPGWIINRAALTCTCNSVLEPGASYPPITLRASATGRNPPSSLAPTVTVSGGGT
jgi:hypothetical protein